MARAYASRGLVHHAPSPRQPRYDARMLHRADDLAKLTVLDEQGKAVELGTLWRDRPAVLVFTRHFG